MNRKHEVEYSFREISEVLNMNPATVKSIYDEAMHKIGEGLKCRGISIEDLIQ